MLGQRSRNVSKKVILNSDLRKLCDQIENPPVQLALRLRAILLTGVVMIYHRQVGFLLSDVQKAIKRLQTMHQSSDAAVDLPGDGKASFKSITLRPIEEGNAQNMLLEAMNDQLSFMLPEGEAVRGDKLDLHEENILPRFVQDAADVSLPPIMQGFSGDPHDFFQDEFLRGFEGGFDDYGHVVAMDVAEDFEPAQEQENPASNPLLEAIGEQDMLTKKRKRTELRKVKSDATTRISAAQMRKNLADHNKFCVERPRQEKRATLPENFLDLPNVEGLCDPLKSLLLAARTNASSYVEQYKENPMADVSEVDIEQRRALDEFEMADIDFGDEGFNFSEAGLSQSPRGGASASFGSAISESPISHKSRLTGLDTPGDIGIHASSSEWEDDEVELQLVSPSSSYKHAAGGELDSRTFKLKRLLRATFEEEGPKISFNALTEQVSKQAAASAFYHVMLLASTNNLELDQPGAAYSDIFMEKGAMF